jgi:adenosine deaminase
MSKGFSEAFLRKLPKTDLHLHLDGSLRLPTLIELAKKEGVGLPSWELSGLRELVFKNTYTNLPEYLAGFQYTCAVMQNAENLERIAYELAQDNLEEGVRYIEVRFAPQLHIHEQLSIREVLAAVSRGLERAKSEHNRTVKEGEDVLFEYGIIVCALRYFNEHMSSYYKNLFSLFSYASDKMKFSIASEELARAAVALSRDEGFPVVGFDLAGAESGFPAGDHTRAFGYAHSNFLKKTVHAGEAYGPESIFQAITDCHANRIGHGTFLFMPDKIQNEAIVDPEKYIHFLADYIATQRITIEVNLTSNLQTIPTIQCVSEHPLRQMLEHNLSVSICTDNRLMSNTTVTCELQLAVTNLPVTRRQLKNIIIAGFKGSFYRGPYREKRDYVRQVQKRYEAVEAEFADELPI